jgi:hypothetical protein
MKKLKFNILNEYIYVNLEIDKKENINVIFSNKKEKSKNNQDNQDNSIQKIKNNLSNNDKIILLKNLIQSSKINHKNQILLENNLKEAHIYCKINNLSGQLSGSILENYIIEKYNMKKNNSSNLCGDCNFNGKNYEIKISLGGNKSHMEFNYVQIRINHNIQVYILTAYYLNIKNYENLGELFIFFIENKDMKDLIVKYGQYAHGTKKINGNITFEDINCNSNKKEYALRPKYNDNLWKKLLNYRINDINLI